MANNKISVIIPTFNRVDTLRLTLDSFLDQSYPSDYYEIIVSNNNSMDATEQLVHEYIQRSNITVKYVLEERQGVHYARNSGAKKATGELLYFTDDDMVADRFLLEEIVKIFAFDPEVASVTGRVLPRWETHPPYWVKKLMNNSLLSINDPKIDFLVSFDDCNVFSCHQAIRKDVFFKTGGFNPENTAGEWIGDGETGLNIKIKKLGYKFGFNGRSIIYHIIPKSRMSQSYFNRRLGNQGNCDSYTAYREYGYSQLELIGKIAMHVAELIRSAMIMAINYLLLRTQWRYHCAKNFYYLKRLSYDFKLLTDSSWRALVTRNDWLADK